jgi:large subunit ribosomal protein L21e
VIAYKVVNGRYMEKRVNVRIEHVRHSKCRQEFLDRVKSNAAKKREAKAAGETIVLKRLPAQPREARVIKIQNNVPQTLTALPYETTI